MNERLVFDEFDPRMIKVIVDVVTGFIASAKESKAVSRKVRERLEAVQMKKRLERYDDSLQRWLVQAPMTCTPPSPSWSPPSWLVDITLFAGLCGVLAVKTLMGGR